MSKTILIVEDNELNMRLFDDLLQAHGYGTVQTADGREAIDLAREHHPDLILMDIQLPEISGLEVTKILKADDDLKTIPVIAVNPGRRLRRLYRQTNFSSEFPGNRFQLPGLKFIRP